MSELINAGINLAWHSVRRTFSVIATLLVIGGIAWAVYVAFVRPTTKPNATTRQEAENMVNYNYTPKQTFGCMAIFPGERPQKKETEKKKP